MKGIEFAELFCNTGGFGRDFHEARSECVFAVDKIKCASFFAGVGGIDLAFEQTGNFEIIYANEFDEYAAKTYEENSSVKVDCRDINTVRTDEIPDFDVMLAGFPCQAFSIAGYREGFNDKKGRGGLFFQLQRIFLEKKPKIIFLENVKNLVNHDNGNTFKVILSCLQDAGYYTKYQVLNAKDYGNVPQNRERIYIVAFSNEEFCKNFTFPEPIALTTKISDIICFDNKTEDKYYYTQKCPFYKKLEDSVIRSDTVYQWRRFYVRENKNNVCPALTANMGTGGHNVPLVKTKHGIRKLTPKECFAFQGFPETFKIPANMTDSKLYKQAGNSVIVPVICRIAENIALAIRY